MKIIFPRLWELLLRTADRRHVRAVTVFSGLVCLISALSLFRHSWAIYFIEANKALPYRQLLVVVGLLVLVGVIYSLRELIRERDRLRRELKGLQAEKAQFLHGERDRIAAEMHDNLGGGLTTIRFLSLLVYEKPADPGNALRVEKIARLSAELLERIAEVIWEMDQREETLENIGYHLQRYAGDFLETHGIEFHFEFEAPLPAIMVPAGQRRALLLSMKECLHNVVKHAGATEVWLRLHVNGHLELSIRDNGQGVSAASVPAGQGLRNLRQHMARHGGSATIESQGGTTVVLRSALQGPTTAGV